MSSAPAPSPLRRDLAWPLALTALALLVRIAWLLTHRGLIGEEGAYYARLADNLAAGRGWLGIREQGLQLFYPPLYPLSVAALTHLMPVELAGRLVSVGCGALLVPAVWSLARRMGCGPFTVRLAATLAALHPFLIAISTAVLSESLYLTLITVGCAWGLAAMEEKGWRASALAGGSFGLAYLTRPEALLFPLLLGGGLLLWHWRAPRDCLTRVAALGLVFTICAAPYVLWLHGVTGGWHLETKSADNYAYAQRLASGMTSDEAFTRVEPDLTETGLSMRPNLVSLQTVHVPPGAELKFLAVSARVNGPRLVQALVVEPALGGPLLAMLVVLGWIATGAWGRDRLHRELALLVVLASLLLPLFTLQQFFARYALPFLPFLLVPGARGVEAVARWGRETAAALEGFWRPLFRLAPAVLLLALLAQSARGVRTVGELQPGDPSFAVLGTWITTHIGQHQVLTDIDPRTAFYGDGVDVPYPFATSDVAVRYLVKRGVTLVVVRPGERSPPYLSDWAAHGPPIPGAALVYQLRDSQGRPAQLYRVGDVPSRLPKR